MAKKSDFEFRAILLLICFAKIRCFQQLTLSQNSPLFETKQTLFLMFCRSVLHGKKASRLASTLYFEDFCTEYNTV